MMDERKDARTDGRTWATLNALPHSTKSGGIKNLKEGIMGNIHVKLYQIRTSGSGDVAKEKFYSRKDDKWRDNRRWMKTDHNSSH